MIKCSLEILNQYDPYAESIVKQLSAEKLIDNGDWLGDATFEVESLQQLTDWLMILGGRWVIDFNPDWNPWNIDIEVIYYNGEIE